MEKLTLKEMIEACVGCGKCTEVCPFYKATGNEEYGAMAKVGAARTLFSGEELSEESLKTLLLCTRCDRCVPECPAGVSVPDIIQSARAEIRRKGLWPQKCSDIARSIVEKGSPMGAPPTDRLAYLPPGFEPPEKAEYLYVPGCWSSLRLPETARASLQLLIRGGLDVTVLGERERCCGLFLVDNGLIEEVRAIAEEITLLFESTSARVVIAECPGCYDLYKNIYPGLFRKPNYEVIYISDMLKDLVEKGKITVSNSGKKIIYKDPCPLARRHNIIETPRTVLGSVAEVVEFEEHGKDTSCCGAPAGVKPLFPEIANSLVRSLLDEASSKGVTEVGVCCPFCMHHMKGALKGPEDLLTIRSLSQILLANLDERA